MTNNLKFYIILTAILITQNSLSVFATTNQCEPLFKGKLSQKSSSRTEERVKEIAPQVAKPENTEPKWASRYTHSPVVIAEKQYQMAYMDQIPRGWNGKTIVLVPGLSKSALFYEKHAELFLAQGYRVLRFDPFNINETLRVNGSKPLHEMSLEQDAEGIAQIVKSLNLAEGSVQIAGHSRGAGVTVHLALLLGKKLVYRVTLVNPFVSWLSDYAVKDLTKKIENVLRLNPMTLFAPRAFKNYVESMTSYFSRQYAQGTIDFMMSATDFKDFLRKALRHRDSSENTSLEFEDEVNALYVMFTNLKNVSILPQAKQLAELGFDVDVVTVRQKPGQKDDLVPEEAGRDLRHALNIQEGSSQDVRVDGTHYYPTENPRGFVNAVTRSDTQP